jgi:hypothetical protein
VQERVDTGSVLVTKENLDTPDVQAAVKPELEKWLGAN